MKRASARRLLMLVALLAAAGSFVTMTRFPAPTPDTQLYASIARSRELYGSGVPSTLIGSPRPVDHIDFYGPVFFDLSAASFKLFGISRWSIRLVSLIAAIVLVGAGAWLAWSLAGTADRACWAAALLALTPEIGIAATKGDMETTAVALQLLALAAFVSGWVSGRHRIRLGIVSGVALALAALTTPRSYPFVAVFIASALGLDGMRLRRAPATIGDRQVLRVLAMVAVVAAGLWVWSVVSHGGPSEWVRYMAFILTREDTDVAVLPTAVRVFNFNWSAVVTPLFALAGAALAAVSFHRHQASGERRHAAMFAVIVTTATSAIVLIGMNYTFTLGMYFAVPLFAAVAALPRRQLSIAGRGMLWTGIYLLLACDAANLAKRYTRVAAAWDARDPERVVQFVASNVPPQSEVFGPDALYFFAVERSGSRYRLVSETSAADWSRWVPSFEPSQDAEIPHLARPTRRFLIWPADVSLPPEFRCAGDAATAVFEPAPAHLDELGPLGRVQWTGYSKAVLYRLPAGCGA